MKRAETRLKKKADKELMKLERGKTELEKQKTRVRARKREIGRGQS